MQEVQLINYTQDALKTMYVACKTCYSELDAGELWEKSNRLTPELEADEEIMLKLVNKVLKSGHTSIAEHISFTFTLDGISRTLSHQLVRHRVGVVFSQKSQRYVNYHKPFGLVTPDSISENEIMLRKYDCLMDELQAFYSELIKNKIPAEDARYIFPNACETSITMTINLRELIHLCNLRLCLQAQWEIRGLVEKMRDEVVKVYPFVAGLLVPNCNNCTDYRPCKRRKN